MAVSVETAKRELSGELIDIFKLRSGPLLAKIEACATLIELRQVIFTILDETRGPEPQKARQLLLAWESLDRQ